MIYIYICLTQSIYQIEVYPLGDQSDQSHGEMTQPESRKMSLDVTNHQHHCCNIMRMATVQPLNLEHIPIYIYIHMCVYNIDIS